MCPINELMNSSRVKHQIVYRFGVCVCVSDSLQTVSSLRDGGHFVVLGAVVFDAAPENSSG